MVMNNLQGHTISNAPMSTLHTQTIHHPQWSLAYPGLHPLYSGQIGLQARVVTYKNSASKVETSFHSQFTNQILQISLDPLHTAELIVTEVS